MLLRAPIAILFCLAGSLLALAGCQKADEIEQYSVDKPETLQKKYFPDSPAIGAGGQVATSRQDRMVAAIVPHGDRFWFFKIVGPDGVVVDNQKSFVTFLNTLKFDSAADAPPQWTLPEGWTQKPGSEMRFATIVMSGDKTPLELAISWLPKPEADSKALLDKALLENVNRWRGQFRLRPIGSERLTDELHKFKIADTTAYLIAITGRYQAGGMAGAPFAGGPGGSGLKGNGDGGLPDGHPPVDMPAGHPPIKIHPGDAPAAAGPGADIAPPSDLKFTKPESWKVGSTTGISVASFVVADGDRTAQITATPLGGDLTPESLLMNVNRWRGQLGLDPLDQTQVNAAVKKISIDGVQASYVELVGPERTILAAIVPRQGQMWFLKLQGDKQLAQREKANFESFVKSIKFADDGGGK